LYHATREPSRLYFILYGTAVPLTLFSAVGKGAKRRNNALVGTRFARVAKRVPPNDQMASGGRGPTIETRVRSGNKTLIARRLIDTRAG
jgi:hypothetical protein